MKIKKLLFLLFLLPLIACSKPTIDDSVLGYYDDTIYFNTYFNFSVKLNKSWDVNTDKIFDETTISTSDLHAQKDGGFSTINITIKKLKEIEDENDLVLRYKDEIQKLIEANETLVSIENGSEILGDQAHPYILTHSVALFDDNKSVDIFEKQFIIKKEDYIAIVTLTTFHGDDTEKLVSLFM